MTAEETRASCVRHRSSLALSCVVSCLYGKRYLLGLLIYYV